MSFEYLKVGDKVYVAATSLRYDDKSSDGEVIKVGRKYLTIRFGSCRTAEFRRDNGDERSNYSPNFCLYTSKEVYDEKQKAIKLAQKMASFLTWHKHDFALNELITAAKAIGMSDEYYD